MAEVQTSVTGPVSVHQAWERYAVPARWPTWAPHLRRVELDPGHPRGVGTSSGGDEVRLTPGMSGRVHGPWPVSATFTVNTVQRPARRWSWTVHALGLRLRLTHTLDQVPAGTKAGLIVSGPWAVVQAYRPIARSALRRLVGSTAG